MDFNISIMCNTVQFYKKKNDFNSRYLCHSLAISAPPIKMKPVQKVIYKMYICNLCFIFIQTIYICQFQYCYVVGILTVCVRTKEENNHKY